LVVGITDLFWVWEVVSVCSMALNCTSFTYHLMLAIGPFPILDYVPVNIGNEGVGVRNVVMNVRNSHVCIYCKLSLRINSQ